MKEKKQQIISSSYHIVDYFDLLIRIACVRAWHITDKKATAFAIVCILSKPRHWLNSYEPFEFAKLLLELAYVLLRLLSLVWILAATAVAVVTCDVEPTLSIWLPSPLNPWQSRLFSIWFKRFEKFCILIFDCYLWIPRCLHVNQIIVFIHIFNAIQIDRFVFAPSILIVVKWNFQIYVLQIDFQNQFVFFVSFA